MAGRSPSGTGFILGRDVPPVHRSSVVSLKDVKALVRNESGRGVIHVKSRAETVSVSDAYMHLFKQM